MNKNSKLMEMLTGKVVHRGKTISDTLASVLAREPTWGVALASPGRGGATMPTLRNGPGWRPRRP